MRHFFGSFFFLQLVLGRLQVKLDNEPRTFLLEGKILKKKLACCRTREGKKNLFMFLAWYIGIAVGLSIGGSTWLVCRFSSSRFIPVLFALAIVSFSLAMVVGLIVPLDVLLLGPNSKELDTAWIVLFWLAFVLMWLALPLVSEYYSPENGAFTTWQRLGYSLRANTRLFIAMGLVTLVGAIYLHTFEHISWANLAGFAVIASNVWGLVTLVVLAGFGLVDVPRVLWRAQHLNLRRDAICFEAATSAHDRLEEARDTLHHTLVFLQDNDKWQLDADDREARLHLNDMIDVCRAHQLPQQRHAGVCVDLPVFFESPPVSATAMMPRIHAHNTTSIVGHCTLEGTSTRVSRSRYMRQWRYQLVTMFTLYIAAHCGLRGCLPVAHTDMVPDDASDRCAPVGDEMHRSCHTG